MNSFGKKNNKYAFSFIELDSNIVAKIEVKFTATHIIMKVIFQYINGSPFSIPSIYQNLLIEQAENDFQKHLISSINGEQGAYSFQYGFKLDSNCDDPISTIQNNLENVIKEITLIYQRLVSLGFIKRKCLNTFRLSRSRWNLLKNVADVLMKTE